MTEGRCFDFYLSRAGDNIGKLASLNEKENIFKNIKKDFKENDVDIFYPRKEDLACLPSDTVLLKIHFTLKRPYFSREQDTLIIKNGGICENPLRRDSLTKWPIIASTSWKGYLRWAARHVEYGEEEKKKAIITRLWGNEPQEEGKQGRLYFYTTFFSATAGSGLEKRCKNGQNRILPEDPDTEDSDTGTFIINPLKRDSRVSARGPLSFEVLKKGSKGVFCLLYFPCLAAEEKEQKEDLEFLALALQNMFYKYGFSAKNKLGFGTIEKLSEKDVKVFPENKKSFFSVLYAETPKRAAGIKKICKKR